jgi:hypothetical protein
VVGVRRARLGVATGALAALLALPCAAGAQASPYLPLDDTRYPLLELLIARGELEDPSPMLRPFRVADALRVLAAADTAPASRTGSTIRRLREELSAGSGSRRWSAEIRVGGTAYTQKRRDLLQLGGRRDYNYYLDVGLQGVFGPLAASARPAVEPRLIGDPDWPNTTQEHVTGRLIEGYLSGQLRWASLTYGQLDWNWGPVGLPGIPLSNFGYQRPAISLDVRLRPLRLSALATTLRRETDSLGQIVNRYYFAHRLEAQFSSRFRAALWEGILIQGVGQNFDFAYANPLAPSVLTNGFGISDQPSNTIIGADLSWRPFRRTTLQAQLGLDDFWFNKREQKQDRWTFTLMGFGPLGRELAWRVLYTQVSSLALRTFSPVENLTDAKVGLGRHFTDQDRISAYVSVPLRRRWVLTPELSVQRQGEGAINAPYPRLGPDSIQTTPLLFIGEVEKTYRVSLGLAGREGPLDLTADAGFHHVTSAGHQPGVTANRFVGRIQATLAWRRQGNLGGADSE